MLFFKFGGFRCPSFTIVTPSPNLSAVAADYPNEVLTVHRHGKIGIATLESGGQNHNRVYLPSDSFVLASVDSAKCFLAISTHTFASQGYQFVVVAGYLQIGKADRKST